MNSPKSNVLPFKQETLFTRAEARKRLVARLRQTIADLGHAAAFSDIPDAVLADVAIANFPVELNFANLAQFYDDCIAWQRK